MENLERHNNIFVNNILSRERKLHDGDLIRMDTTTFRFLDGKGKKASSFEVFSGPLELIF